MVVLEENETRSTERVAFPWLSRPRPWRKSDTAGSAVPWVPGPRCRRCRSRRPPAADAEHAFAHGAVPRDLRIAGSVARDDREADARRGEGPVAAEGAVSGGARRPGATSLLPGVAIQLATAEPLAAIATSAERAVSPGFEASCEVAIQMPFGLRSMSRTSVTPLPTWKRPEHERAPVGRHRERRRGALVAGGRGREGSYVGGPGEAAGRGALRGLYDIGRARREVARPDRDRIARVVDRDTLGGEVDDRIPTASSPG